MAFVVSPSIAFAHRSDGLLSGVEAGDFQSTYAYTTQGLLQSRTQAGLSRTVTARDARGYPTAIATVAGAQTVASETMTYREDFRLASHHSTTLAHTDQWDYRYDSRGWLVQADWDRDGTAQSIHYGFDQNRLGVRTLRQVEKGQDHSWNIPTAGLDPWARMTQEVVGTVPQITAHGYAPGADTVALALDGEPLPVTGLRYDPQSADGRWEYDLRLPVGEHTLTEWANHPSGAYQSDPASSTFTVLPGVGQTTIDTQYDGAGYTQERTYSDGRSQDFTWDADGRLLQISERDTNLDGYEWQAAYDCYGRKLETRHQAIDNDVATGPEIVTRSTYDPESEFQELSVSISDGASTQLWWKIYGPDTNGVYGGLEGIGGWEAVIDESTGEVTQLISDRTGNLLGWREAATGALTWADQPVDGYGPMSTNGPNGSQSTYGGLADFDVAGLLRASVWLGRRMDPTGYHWMGARYYDCVSGRFLSPDPLGHGASWDLYSYANGDPVFSLGVVEAASKDLVAQSGKASGMRWSLGGPRSAQHSSL